VYNETSPTAPNPSPIPVSPEFLTAFAGIVESAGVSDILGLSLVSDGLSLEKTIGKMNILFKWDGKFDEKKHIPTMWVGTQDGHIITTTCSKVCGGRTSDTGATHSGSSRHDK
jgi:hypothetical protein